MHFEKKSHHIKIWSTALISLPQVAQAEEISSSGQNHSFPWLLSLIALFLALIFFYTLYLKQQKIKKLENQLDKITNQFISQKKIAALGEVSAGLAHEINTHLGIILGYTQILLEDARKGSSEEESLQIMERQAISGQHLASNLLKLARHPEEKEQITDISEIANKVLAVLEPNLKLKGIALKRQFTIGLPKVKVHTEQLQQVIINIINNASHAMAGNGILQISSFLESGGVNLAIKDNGPGIPPEIQKRIFEPFFTTKGEGEGTGLGLSLSREIIEKHGGHLSVESPLQEGSGTVFTIWLPGTKEKANG